MTTEFLKSDSFNMQFQKTGKSPAARLIGLSGILSNWNKQRIGKVINGKEADLSINDIQILKNLIENETSRLKLNNAEIIADQILFMLIGAIKLQIQNNSDKPWELVNQSISNFLSPKKSPQKLMVSLSVFTVIVIMGLAITILNTNRKMQTNHMDNPLDTAAISHNGSETVSNLVGLYNAMKSGVCQLPQAAMLQPQEREAFLAFINEGKVDINTADSLKNALTYANCLYPQKLMNSPL